MGSLTGKVALVSGGASGIGAATARLFAAEGAEVVIGDVSVAAGEALAAEIGAAFFQLNVASEANWQDVVARVETRLGRLDILVNCAGVHVAAPIWETTEADCRRLFEVNQLGVFLGVKSVIEPMTRAGGGAVVNISSGAGLTGTRNLAFYSATKYAVRGIARSAALELAPRGIRVNTVFPGPIDTPMLADNTDRFRENLLARVPLRRIGEPREIAEAALFLASDRSSFVTGAELAVDGGITA